MANKANRTFVGEQIGKTQTQTQNGNVHISLSIGQSGAGLFVVMGAGPEIQHCWGVFSMLDIF